MSPPRTTLLSVHHRPSEPCPAMHYQCWLYPEVPPAVRSPWKIYEDEVAVFAAEVPDCPARRNFMSPILARGVLPVFLELEEENQRMWVDAALTELAAFVRWRRRLQRQRRPLSSAASVPLRSR